MQRLVGAEVHLLAQLVVEARVGQGDAGVVGQRLQHREVRVRERLGVAEAVGDGDGPDQTIVAGHPDHHGVAEPPLVQQLARVRVAGAARRQHGQGQLRGVRGEQVGRALAAGGPALPRPQQGDLGPRAGQLLDQVVQDHARDLIAAALGDDRAGELVEALELVVALPEDPVGALGEEQHEDEHGERPADAPVHGHEHDRGDPDRGVCQLRQRTGGDRLAQGTSADVPIVQPHGEEDGRGSDQVHDGDGDQDTEPSGGAQSVAP